MYLQCICTTNAADYGGGGLNGEYMFCIQLFFCNVIVTLQHFREILLCSTNIGIAVYLYYIAQQYI